MAIELKVPTIGESITEVEIGDWLIAEGEWVAEDTPVVVVESDKASLEVPAPAAGKLTKILKKTGEAATIGEVIGTLEAGAKPEADQAPQPEAGQAPQPEAETRVMPAAARALAQAGLQASQVAASGPGGRLLKEDVPKAGTSPPPPTAVAQAPAAPAPAPTTGARREEAVRMTTLRRRLAERLVEAQQTAALLTTFNEADMSAVIALREQYKDAFLKRHGVKLGFMSFFVKAVIAALREIPALNAEIRGQEIVYRHYYDVGVAVGGGKGLVVPVIRNAEQLSFAGIELAIADLATRARDNKLELSELQGGTFSISNGGIYGSMLSTPIVNPPQSGILGLHAIKDRPVALDGQVVIRPIMYLALTYDHRIVDGREAVTFLVRVKETVEQPSRLLLEV